MRAPTKHIDNLVLKCLSFSYHRTTLSLLYDVFLHWMHHKFCVFSFSFFPSLPVQMSYLEIVSFASCTAVVLQVLLADWSIPNTYF